MVISYNTFMKNGMRIALTNGHMRKGFTPTPIEKRAIFLREHAAFCQILSRKV